MSDKKEAVRIMSPVGRVTNHSLFEKDVYTDERGHEAVPSYKIEMAFEPGDLEEFEDAIVDVAIDFFGGDAEVDYNEGRLRSPITDGDKMAEEREKRGKKGDAYRGKLVVRAKTIFNRDGTDGPGGVYVASPEKDPKNPDQARALDFAEQGKVYNGCYGQISVTLNPYNGIAGGLPGIGLYLNGFQLVKDGERLRGSDPSSLFSPMMGKDSESKGRRARGKK